MDKINQYKDIKFIKTVVGFLIKDNKVLLGTRKKVSNGLGLNIIAGIGGKVGDEIIEETNEQALARELQEEINVEVKEWEYMGVVRFIFPNKPKWCQENRVYRIKSWVGEPQETEAMKPDWYEISNLPKLQMWDDNLYWVPKILKGEKIDMTTLYDEVGQKVIEIKENE